MWKSLNEKVKGKSGRKGFTLTELLVVIGIIAIVCAIAITSIVLISRNLKFKQRNDYAKTIFMAAQQNLSEMRSDGGLMPLQGSDVNAQPVAEGQCGFPTEHWSDEYMYTGSELAVSAVARDTYAIVLPVGSVESALRDQKVIIEYNPMTGNVYSVFYSEDKDGILADYVAGTLPRDEAARKDLMLGYYDGSGLSSQELDLEDTQAQVVFENGQEGIVTVRVPMPSLYYSDHNAFMEALSVNLTLIGETTGGQMDLLLSQSGATASYSVDSDGDGSADATASSTIAVPVEYSLDLDGKTVLIKFALDSLKDGGSFANLVALPSAAAGVNDAGNTTKALPEYMSESEFAIMPGENITILADVQFNASGNVVVEIEDSSLSGVNPMFATLETSVDADTSFVLTVANGRNLQNLNAIAPRIASNVETVEFTADIYWNETVDYYNGKNGGTTYENRAAEAPARSLPYFVPIHNENLFGTARFIYPGSGDGGLGSLIGDILGGLFGNDSDITVAFTGNVNVPTLTDELDANEIGAIDPATGNALTDAEGNAIMTNAAEGHATIRGNGHRVYYLNIDSTRYVVPNQGKTAEKNGVTVDLTGKYYATGGNQIVDYYFTGLFGYINTPIDDLHVVNPIIKGHNFEDAMTLTPVYSLFPSWSWEDGWYYPITGYDEVYLYNNPATGALVGAAGFNTLVTNCSVYIDTADSDFSRLAMAQSAYDADAAQTWYGVSGEGAVGGLIGYAKSHRTTNGELTDDRNHLAFANCFAAVNVSGNMRGTNDKHFGYSNGVGGLIGNSQLTNFYNCYASGNVIASNCRVNDTLTGSVLNSIAQLFGAKLDLLYNGRTSMGAGGFVGTSHGTRYSKSFATGSVTATSKNSLGAGGFVGFMSIDETFSYGNDSNTNAEIAQRTVFTECYSVGLATTNGTPVENFSGANGRIAFKIEQSATYMIGDYYRLYAPHYANYNKTAPDFEDIYIYRDTYYLSNYYESAQSNSNNCASAELYSTFTDLVGSHYSMDSNKDEIWIQEHIDAIKKIELYEENLGTFLRPNMYTHTYDTDYFAPNAPELENVYKWLYAEGYQTGWEAATEGTTHSYSLNAAGAKYPFTKLTGMDYYGDWPSKPSAVGLAYYESYKGDDGKLSFYYDRDSTSELTKDPEAVVVQDGYAVLSATAGDVTVSVGNNTQTWTLSKEDTPFRPGNANTVAPYHVFLLTDDIMQAAMDEAKGNFYIRLTIVNAEGDQYVTYFNPAVALSQVNSTDENKTATQPTKIPDLLYIRSARQFAALSQNQNLWGEDYNYIQQLNIDAAAYEWGAESGSNGVVISDVNKNVGSIGTAADPFLGTYRGNGGYVAQATLTGFQPTDGYFGVIGQTGSVSNLMLELTNNITVGSTSAENAGILAGVNYGTVDNVDLTSEANMSVSASTNAGLLVGLNGVDATDDADNQAAITNCDISVASVTVNAANAGGLVGQCAGEGADKPALITGNTVTVATAFDSNGTNVGGIVGSSDYTTFENLSADMTALTAAKAKYVGAFAGSVTNSTVTTLVVDIAGENAAGAASCLVGVAGQAVSTEFTNMTVNLADDASMSGGIVAGAFGVADKVIVNNANATLPGTLSGVDRAAGFAGTVGAGSESQSVSVTLANGTVKASTGSAAGFAVEVKSNKLSANVYLGQYSKTETFTSISGAKEAAGFACTVSGPVTDSAVVGAGRITSDGTAAGFAVTLSGSTARIGASRVSPARSNSEYAGNSNSNLTVSGATAAGFVVNVDSNATVSNSYTLCELSEDGYGFAKTNKGTIDGCTANVTLTGGYAFVGTNSGTVANCYGWYGNGDEKETNTKVYDSESGKTWYSSYFVDMDQLEDAASVDLFDKNGEHSSMTPAALQNLDLAKLNSSTVSWYSSSVGYASYPYNSNIVPRNYLYPMLRAHYGDWVTPPQYAYGVAYYEIYEDGNSKINVMDLSDPAATKSMDVEDHADKFNKDGVIVEAGYALFFKEGTNPFSSSIKLGDKPLDIAPSSWTDDQKTRYSFYKLESAGELTIGAAKPMSSEEKSVTILTYFANEFNGEDNKYEVRTAGQLANIQSYPAAEFTQTHDITTKDFSTVAEFKGTYDGKDYDITATKATNSWMTKVSGSVELADLTVTGEVSAPIFGTVNNEVTLKSVTTGAVGSNASLISKVSSGTVTTGSITVKSVSGNLIGSIAKNATVQGDASAQKTILIGTADQRADVTVNLVSTVNGTLKNYTVNTGKLSTSIVSTLSGELNKISLNPASASLTSGALVNKMTGGNITECVVATDIITVQDGVTVFGVVTSTVPAGASVTNTTVKAKTINVNDLTATIGGLVGENMGTISGCVVQANTDSGNTAINLGSDSSTSDRTLVVGGLAGTNAGKINSNSSANVAISYNQLTAATAAREDEISTAAEVEESETSEATEAGEVEALSLNDGIATVADVASETVTIGGLVGENSGTINGATVNGSIATNASASGKSFIIGGAVGKDDGATYENITSTVAVADQWKGLAYHVADSKLTVTDVIKTMVSPNGVGPVGQFVGFAGTGSSFTNCKGNGGSAVYQFVGQVQHTQTVTFTEGYYGEFDSQMVSHQDANKDDLDNFKAASSAAGKTIVNFNLTLKDCYYTQGSTSVKQEISNTGYYYKGIDDQYEQYSTTLVGDAGTITFTANSALAVGSFSSFTSRGLTDYYYEKDGNYYPVWAEYESNKGMIYTFRGVQLWADLNLDGALNNSERFVNISGAYATGNTDSAKSIGETLYSASVYSLSDGNYLIVGGASKALMGSGSATDFAASFTSKDALASAVWNHTAGVWSQGSNYLNLNSGVTGTAPGQITLGIARAGKDGLVFSLNGGKYLTYKNSDFSTGNNHIGEIKLYSVSSEPMYEVVFSEEMVGQFVLPGTSNATSAASLDDEIVEETIPTDGTVGGGTQNDPTE